jgi:hypothetical protein
VAEYFVVLTQSISSVPASVAFPEETKARI